MPDNSCALCRAKVKTRITHQHGPEHFRSPANPHGGQAGLWHDVRWSDAFNRWSCDAKCRGGYGKVCRHIEDVIAILKDEHTGWLGEVPKRTPAPVLAPVVAIARGKRLEDLYQD